MLTQEIGGLGERVWRYEHLLEIAEHTDQEFIVKRVECLETTVALYQLLIRGADDEEYEQVGVEEAAGGHRVSRRLPPPGA